MFVCCWGSEKAYLCVTLTRQEQQIIIGTANSSQLRSTKRLTRHTILGCDELTVWWVDWHPPTVSKYQLVCRSMSAVHTIEVNWLGLGGFKRVRVSVRVQRRTTDRHASPLTKISTEHTRQSQINFSTTTTKYSTHPINSQVTRRSHDVRFT